MRTWIGILLGSFFLTSVAARAQQPAWQPPAGHLTMEIWPKVAPGAASGAAAEADLTTAKDNVVGGKPVMRLGNVSRPTITVYKPGKNNTGAAVVVFPGGGYKILAIDLEGTEVCDWLTSVGVTCVLLKYRVPDTGPLPKSEAALQDAQRSVGMVRAHAREWGIDAKRIGVLGFSAGAHLAAALSTHFEKRAYGAVDAADDVSCRPDFAVLVYPGYLAVAEQNFAANAEIKVTGKTPPAFIVQTEDDPVHVESATVYFQLLKNAKVPAELHVYAEGGHGYGLRKTAQPVTSWPGLVETWLHTIKVLASGDPVGDWPKGSASDYGVDDAKLAAFDAELAAEKFSLVDSFKLIRCGTEIYEKKYAHDYAKIYGKEAAERGPLNPHLTGPYNYFDPAWHPYYQGTELHSMQSVSKSVTSTIIGIAITRGDFKASLDAPVLKYFDAAKTKNVDERKRRMTIRHVLTMTTGIDWNEEVAYDDPKNDTAVMEGSEDWVQYVIDRPMAHEPGKLFNYSSGNTELLAQIFLKETGQDVETYGQKFLFEPLGIAHFWKRTPMGLPDTEGGLYLSDDGMAKFGTLFLRDGVWNGQRILSHQWVKDAMTPFTTSDEEGGYGYGYQWWLWPRKDGGANRYVWMGRGFGGQRLMIFPEEEMIAVFTGWKILGDEPGNAGFVERILGAVKPHACSAK